MPGEVVRHTSGLETASATSGMTPSSPPSDLVAEQPEASGESGSDRSLHDDAACRLQHGRQEPGLCSMTKRPVQGHDDESRVIEVTRAPSLKTRADRLEQLSTQPHDACPAPNGIQ